MASASVLASRFLPCVPTSMSLPAGLWPGHVHQINPFLPSWFCVYDSSRKWSMAGTFKDNSSHYLFDTLLCWTCQLLICDVCICGQQWKIFIFKYIFELPFVLLCICVSQTQLRGPDNEETTDFHCPPQPFCPILHGQILLIFYVKPHFTYQINSC